MTPVETRTKLQIAQRWLGITCLLSPVLSIVCRSADIIFQIVFLISLSALFVIAIINTIHARKLIQFKLIHLMIVMAIIAIIAMIAIPANLGSKKSDNETSAQKQMVNVVEVEREWWYKRGIGQNGKPSYYVYDYAGLYYAQDKDGKSIAYIDIASAYADAAVIKNWATLSKADKAIPTNGYLIAAIAKDGDGVPYAQVAVGDTTLGSDTIIASTTKICNATKFAFCAYPAVYGQTGISIYIVDQSGTVYQKDTGKGEPILQWPVAEGKDPTTAGWAIATD